MLRPFTLKSIEMQDLIVGDIPEFPKYTTQLINLANQNAQGTRPKVVGQMSELSKQFPGGAYDSWVHWYGERYPDAIENATDRVYAMVQNLKQAIQQIDRSMVHRWIQDLVLTKTFVGIRVEQAILAALSRRLNLPFRNSNPADESRGIDGYIGDRPVSIKPTTYKSKASMAESIGVPIVYYEKKGNDYRIDPSSLLF